MTISQRSPINRPIKGLRSPSQGRGVWRSSWDQLDCVYRQMFLRAVFCALECAVDGYPLQCSGHGVDSYLYRGEVRYVSEGSTTVGGLGCGFADFNPRLMGVSLAVCVLGVSWCFPSLPCQIPLKTPFRPSSSACPSSCSTVLLGLLQHLMRRTSSPGLRWLQESHRQSRLPMALIRSWPCLLFARHLTPRYSLPTSCVALFSASNRAC